MSAASSNGVLGSFDRLLSNAINVLGTDGVNQASVDLSGNGYAPPILVGPGSGGVGYSTGFSTTGSNSGSFVMIAIVVVVIVMFLKR